MRSIPGSVGYISHLHRAYDYLGPSGFSGYIWLDTKIVLKNPRSSIIAIRSQHSFRRRRHNHLPLLSVGLVYHFVHLKYSHHFKTKVFAVAYFGRGALGHGPPFGRNFVFFTIEKSRKTKFGPPLCEH